jgi:hypothetical protein
MSRLPRFHDNLDLIGVFGDISMRTNRERYTIVTLRSAVVFLLVAALPLIAQVDPPRNPEGPARPEYPPMQEVAEPAAPARKLKLISEAQTVNYLAKFDGTGTGSVIDSIMFENNGRIGIGTASPATTLHVAGDYYGVATKAGGGMAINGTQIGVSTAAGAQWDTGLYAEGRAVVSPGIMNNGGAYGAQITARNYGLGSAYYLIGGRFNTLNVQTGTVNYAYGVTVDVTKGAGTIVNGYGLLLTDVQATNAYGIFQEGIDDTNVFRGKVVLGPPIAAPDFVPPATNALNVNGDVHFNGTVTGKNIKAHYQDVAEWVPATSDLTPGTVVILNRERDNEVMASASAYDTTVAGVVSSQPGLSLGIEGEGKEQIATTGRVKVRVDARRTPVRVGDLLVTSDTPGTAMRSEPTSINGRPFHQPGTIIGKALQPLDGVVGEILVLLSMQ